MAIPGSSLVFERALLQALGDGAPHAMRDLVASLAVALDATPEDLAARYASGDLKFENKVWWARQRLKEQGALASPARGMVCITTVGQQALAALAASVPGPLAPAPPAVPASAALPVPPEEALDAAMTQMEQALCAEVLARVKTMPPQHFERLVVDLLLAMGYGFDRSAGHVTRYGGDGGIDGLVHEDKLGLSTLYVQAKRFTDSNVGRPDVQQFLGALTGAGATKGVFITSSGFTREAREFAQRLQNQKVVLLDGERLAQLMVEHNVGVATTRMLAIRHLDNDYFDGRWAQT